MFMIYMVAEKGILGHRTGPVDRDIHSPRAWPAHFPRATVTIAYCLLHTTDWLYNAENSGCVATTCIFCILVAACCPPKIYSCSRACVLFLLENKS